MDTNQSAEQFAKQFIDQAIALAESSMERGEGGPFAALVVRDGGVLGRGWNRVTSSNDPTAHAEVEAIRDATRRLGDFSLAGCTLYVNCEPCPMCLAAAYWAGISAIYYAADRADAAAIGFADQQIYEELALPPEQRRLPMHQINRPAALPLFRRWQEKPDKIPY